ncbi:MAG: 4Fe-4S dicluster domain-containing protein [Acidobacteriota bacterium]
MGLKKLFIDIPRLLNKPESVDKIKCEYMYHRENRGVFSLLEVAQFAAYCRRCEEAFCVLACPREALERQENGLIKRYNMRCVGCKSCILACPFGTVFPEVINYVTAKCDYCLNQLKDNPDYQPLCVKTSPPDALKMVQIEEEDSGKHIYFSGDNLAVRTPGWRQKEERA